MFLSQVKYQENIGTWLYNIQFNLKDQDGFLTNESGIVYSSTRALFDCSCIFCINLLKDTCLNCFLSLVKLFDLGDSLTALVRVYWLILCLTCSFLEQPGAFPKIICQHKLNPNQIGWERFRELKYRLKEQHHGTRCVWRQLQRIMGTNKIFIWSVKMGTFVDIYLFVYLFISERKQHTQYVKPFLSAYIL